MLVKTFYFPVDVSLYVSVATGKSYKIRQYLTCRTDFVIYCAFVKNVIDSVSVQPLISDAVCPTIRAKAKTNM